MHDLRHWIDLCETQETGGADEFDVIAYHGSNQDFDSFDEATIRPNRWGPHGFCFVQDPRAAAFYGDIVYKVELRIQNPKIVQNVEDFHSFKNRERQLQMSGVDAVAGPNELGQFEIVVFDPANIRILNKIGTVKEASGTVGAGQRRITDVLRESNNKGRLVEKFVNGIWIDPSRQQLLALAKRHSLRGTVIDGHLHVWNAADETHYGVHSELVGYEEDYLGENDFMLGRLEDMEDWRPGEIEVAPGIFFSGKAPAEAHPVIQSLIHGTKGGMDLHRR